MLFVTVLMNAFGWAFGGVAVTHEFDHERRVLSLDPTAHLDAHQQSSEANGSGGLDAAIHLYLHAFGQYAQPLLLGGYPLAVIWVVMEVLAEFEPAFIPGPIADSPLRPPQNTFAR